MDDPVFDAMLKNALEEALRLDAEAAPAAPPPGGAEPGPGPSAPGC